MPAKFVNRIQMFDADHNTEFWIESHPAAEALAIGMTRNDETVYVELPYSLAPQLAERICQLVSKEARTILASDDEYPDL